MSDTSVQISVSLVHKTLYQAVFISCNSAGLPLVGAHNHELFYDCLCHCFQGFLNFAESHGLPVSGQFGVAGQ